MFIERGFSEDLSPQDRERVRHIYSRLVLFREEQGKIWLLMQRLRNGKLVFPGGEDQLFDGDSIETLIRELGEETTVERGDLRTLRNCDLIYYSARFHLDWGRGGRNRDVYFVLPGTDQGKDYWPRDSLGVARDTEEEIEMMGWVALSYLIEGEGRKEIHRNTLQFCRGLKAKIDEGFFQDWGNLGPVESIELTLDEVRAFVRARRN